VSLGRIIKKGFCGGCLCLPILTGEVPLATRMCIMYLFFTTSTRTPKPSPENGANAVTDAFRFLMQAYYEMVDYEMVESENAVICLPSLFLRRLLGE